MITVIQNTLKEFESLDKAITEAESTKELYWIDINMPTDNDFIVLKNHFNFHPITLSDCTQKLKRSKMHDYKEYHFITVTVFENLVKGNSSYKNIHIFITEKFILTIHYNECKIIKKIFNEFQNSSKVFINDTDFIMYYIFDEIVEQYFKLTDKIETHIDNLEEKAMNNPVQSTVNEIMKAKKLSLH